MDYSNIILELMSRIQALENKVRSLENANGTERADEVVVSSTEVVLNKVPDFTKISPKYRPLAVYLVERGERIITLNYMQIQEILGFELPSSARNHMNQYWANTTSHSYSSSWLNVGYMTRVNVENETVTFEKVR